MAATYFPNIVKFLVDQGLDVNVQDILGRTTLHHAIIESSISESILDSDKAERCLETAKLLLTYKANITLNDSYGKNPLHYAKGLVNISPH